MPYIDNSLMIFDGIADHRQTPEDACPDIVTIQLTLSSKFVSEKDHVLIIDDFLANGEAATGAIRLIRKAHATIAGVGVLIEKAFQPGHKKLVSQGFDVYPLARISHMAKDEIEFLED